jgi:RNA polymerase sigma factor (TIGR02999 family)
MPEPQDATFFLARLNDGDAAAADGLLNLIYEELRALAGSLFRGQPADHTLQPTALVHEAFIRLIDQTRVQFNDRAHFFAVAATAMRQILTDHARRTGSQKRGGDWKKVDLSAITPALDRDEVDVVVLDEALSTLAEADTRQARVVELRFFGGLTMEEIARVVGVSKATVELDWRTARAWLGTQLRDH